MDRGEPACVIAESGLVAIPLTTLLFNVVIRPHKERSLYVSIVCIINSCAHRLIYPQIRARTHGVTKVNPMQMHIQTITDRHVDRPKFIQASVYAAKRSHKQKNRSMYCCRHNVFVCYLSRYTDDGRGITMSGKILPKRPRPGNDRCVHCTWLYLQNCVQAIATRTPGHSCNVHRFDTDVLVQIRRACRKYAVFHFSRHCCGNMW